MCPVLEILLYRSKQLKGIEECPGLTIVSLDVILMCRISHTSNYTDFD